MRCRWALFDVGETLIHPRESFGAVYAHVLETLGLMREPVTLERALRATWTEVNASLPSGVDRYHRHPGGEDGYWLSFVCRTLELSGGAPSGLAERAIEPLRSAFAHPEAWTVFPDVEPALDRLAAAGIRLGIVSNWDSRLPSLLERLGLARRFDAVAVSGLAGVEKPHPALFQRAMVDLEAHPAATVHVGDMPDLDVAGARAAGIRPILVDRAGKLGADAVPDLGAVADLLLA